jgi:hypothetical protein
LVVTYGFHEPERFGFYSSHLDVIILRLSFPLHLTWKFDGCQPMLTYYTRWWRKTVSRHNSVVATPMATSGLLVKPSNSLGNAKEGTEFPEESSLSIAAYMVDLPIAIPLHSMRMVHRHKK